MSQRSRKPTDNRSDAEALPSVKPSGGLSPCPLTRDELNDYLRWHRHHGIVQGYRYAVGAEYRGELVGAMCVGRPVGRLIEQYRIAEVNRVCAKEGGPKGVCSFLYGLAAKFCRMLGFNAVFTYILEEETGVSLKAAGWVYLRTTKGGTSDRPGRRRKDKGPTCPKQMWAPPWARPALDAWLEAELEAA